MGQDVPTPAVGYGPTLWENATCIPLCAAPKPLKRNSNILAFVVKILHSIVMKKNITIDNVKLIQVLKKNKKKRSNIVVMSSEDGRDKTIVTGANNMNLSAFKIEEMYLV